MPSTYLQSTDPTLYGVPSATSQQIAQASTLIDAYLKRPEGLIWTADGSGAPCFMAALTAQYTLMLGASIAPGQNVVVNVTGPAPMVQVGDVLVLDRANTGVTEAAVVVSITGQQVTFGNIQFAHSNGSAAEFGLLIEEQKYMPESRPVTQLAKFPVVNIISGVGRYGYGRRGDGSNYNMEQFNLLAAVSKFGGPPSWEIFSPLNTGYDAQTGQVWIPAGVMLAYYSEVKLRYVAGFTYVTLPPEVKMACANLVRALSSRPQLGAVKVYKAGDTQIEGLADGALDSDTKDMLNMFRARLFV